MYPSDNLTISETGKEFLIAPAYEQSDLRSVYT